MLFIERPTTKSAKEAFFLGGAGIKSVKFKLIPSDNASTLGRDSKEVERSAINLACIFDGPASCWTISPRNGKADQSFPKFVHIILCLNAVVKHRHKVACSSTLYTTLENTF